MTDREMAEYLARPTAAQQRTARNTRYLTYAILGGILGYMFFGKGSPLRIR